MTHHLSLHNMEPQNKNSAGYRKIATKSNFPSLQGMSFYKLGMKPKAVRTPHWHANADELGYCLKGQLLVTFFANRNLKQTFVVNPGEAFFIPSGAFHAIENIADHDAEIILQFSNEELEDFELATAFGMFTNAVLGNTWDVYAKHFEGIKSNKSETFLIQLDKSTNVPEAAYYSTDYRFGLEKSPALVSNEGGSAKMARQNVWPILKRQALYSLRLTGKGMREPHWHPETAEMGYVSEGIARMSILSPSGKIDTYQLQPGDIYFIPKAYPHHIENLNNSNLHMLIFFDQPMPEDVGFTASVRAFSDEILAKTLECKPDVFASLPKYYDDLFIVEKKNPVDK